MKDFGGTTGDHGNHAMSNLFANFKKHHLQTNNHIKNLCRRQGIPFEDHPQSTAPKGKAVTLSNADHERLVKEGTEIVHDVNDTAEEVDGKKSFFIVGDPTAEGFKFRSYWFKVRC